MRPLPRDSSLRLEHCTRSTDGKWCYVLFWVVERGRKATRWDLLKKRLMATCPPALSAFGIENYFSRHQETAAEQKPQIFLLQFSCYDRMGLLHDVTEVLCELELIIRRVKISTTPDGRVMDLFLITDTRELLHTKNRRDEACAQLRAVLGDSMCSCNIEPAKEEIALCLEASSSLPPSMTEDMLSLEYRDESSSFVPRSSVLSVSVDNSLSHAHSLIQIQCHDHKGLLYDIMRTLKDYNIQAEIGRHTVGDREWEVYRVHLGDDHELSASRDKIVKGVTKMLMGWH